MGSSLASTIVCLEESQVFGKNERKIPQIAKKAIGKEAKTVYTSQG